jgi:uncharacterized NAD(P)/FAD-binding protein YdhS
MESLFCNGIVCTAFLIFAIVIYVETQKQARIIDEQQQAQEVQAFKAWLAEKYPQFSRFDWLDEETQQALYQQWREEWARRGIAGLYLANRINPINHDGKPHNDTFGAAHVPFTDSWKHFH